jgi:hypothetical protein
MSFDVAWLRIQVIGTVQGQVRGKWYASLELDPGIE